MIVLQASVGSNVISLEMFNVRPLRKLIYLIFVCVGVLPSEFVVLHLSEMHDKTRKQIALCNNDYKFVVIYIVSCKNLQLKM